MGWSSLLWTSIKRFTRATAVHLPPVSTVDTDIAIYAVYFNRLIQTKLFIKIWVRDHKRIVSENKRFAEAFASLGNGFVFESSLFKLFEEFICHLYGMKNCSSVDEARYQNYFSEKNTPEPQQLPPTQDALLCHLKRVCYVCNKNYQKLFHVLPSDTITRRVRLKP